MPERSDIKELILGSKKKASADMADIRAQDPLTFSFFSGKLRDFVLHKYLLSPDDPSLPEDFSALTDLSLASSMKISPELVKEFDLAKSCDGASSAMAKKVLLFMAVQRELGIELPAMETARISTLSDLSKLTWDTLLLSPAWRDKMV